MTTNQENRVSMITTVLVCMGNNTAEWTNIPAIVQTVKNLKDTDTTLRAVHIIQSQSTEGTTLDKRQQRDALIQALINLVGPLSAYARTQRDNQLRVDVYKSFSSMQQMRDSRLKDYATHVFTLAQKHLTILQSTYGVTANDMINLEIQQALFDSLIAAPRTRKTITKNATSRLADLLDDAAYQLDILDDLMRPYENKNIDFYNIYHNARNIIDLHGKVNHRTTDNQDDATNNPTV